MDLSILALKSNLLRKLSYSDDKFLSKVADYPHKLFIM